MTFALDLAAGRPPVARVSGTAEDLAGHRTAVDEAVAAHGAVLLRGLDLRDEAAAEAAVRAVTSTPMTEREAFAPRATYRPGLHSPTEWPPDQPMCMHHELSYALRVPSRQVFVCLTAPEGGGAVGLA
ncbi:TauD/TfdA family dioxygenase, partial [Streptomyces parvus]